MDLLVEPLQAAKPRANPMKLEQIAAAARRLFFTQGFGATSMEAIAREAGIGKATLYENFSNKIDLLRAVVRGELDMREDMLVLDPTAKGRLRDVLAQFAHTLMELLLAPSTVALYRIISSEVPRQPELGEMFYENGPCRVIDKVSAYFAELMEEGRLLPGDARLVAAQFIGLIRADLQTRSLFGVDDDETRRQAALTVEYGVDAFLRAYAR